MKIKDLPKIEQLIELTSQLTKELEKTISEVVKSLEKSDLKYTGKALLFFMFKIGYLDSAILELSASRNLYSVAILYRSIIEHYFKHLYIYTKALKDDNDNTGKIYYKTLKGSEDLQWLDKINKHNKKFGSNKTVWNTNDDHNKVIRKAKEEFRFSEILDYLKSDNDNKYIRTYLLEKSIEYDNLSSVIHGGPFGEQVFCNLQQDKNKFNDNLNKFATDSFNIYCSTVETTYLFASLIDEKLKEHYDKIKEILEFPK